MDEVELAALLEGVDQYAGSYPIDLLTFKPDSGKSYIINLDRSGRRGSHWIALHFVKESRKVYLFDSLNLPMELYYPQLIPFIRRYCNGNSLLCRNDIRLQRYESNLCGYYTVLFILYMTRGASMSDFLLIFKGSTPELNDVILCAFIKTFHDTLEIC